MKPVEQVPQLWQRDRAKINTFLINLQSYSQTHVQNGILGPPRGGIRVNISTFMKVLTQRNFVAEFHRENVSFSGKTANLRFSATFFGTAV